MSKKLLLLIVTLACLLLVPYSVSAHELIKDQVGNAGALLHLNPDDDPRAGTLTTLFFDISDSTVTPQSSKASLTVTDDHGTITTVPTKFLGSSLSASYVFPRKGLYEVKLTINQGDTTTHIFSEPLSVGHGTIGSAPVWAKTGILVTSLGAIVLTIMALKRRKAISQYSKF
jgi:hypothetical protein